MRTRRSAVLITGRPEKQHFRRAVVARVEHLEPWCHRLLVFCALEHDERVRRDPATGAEARQCCFAQAAMIGRVQEDQIERVAKPAGFTPRLVASRRWMRVTPKRPSASMLSRMTPRAAASVSTNNAKDAPREIASKPSAPEPAKRSKTRWPSSPGAHSACASTLKTASRARSLVGRVSRPSGSAIARPLTLPPTIRMGPLLARRFA